MNQDDTSSPLIYIDDDDRNEVFQVTIDFSGEAILDPGEFPKITVGGTLEPETTSGIDAVRRPIDRPTGSYIRFTIDDLLSSDPDLVSSPEAYTELQSSSTAGIACFAVSYGVSDEGDTVYSIPVFLGGRVSIEFPNSATAW